MTRTSYMESEIPTAIESPIYLDGRQIARGMGGHLTECYIGKVTGAGGVGGVLEGVPFQPAYVKCINQAGATPAIHESVFASDAAIHTVTILAVAANATPPVLSGSGVDWDITLPTQMAPNGEVVTVLVFGVRQIGGSL